jgi:hypothetical protein
VDPQALDLANKTLAAAIDSLMAKGAPFSPLVYVQKDGQKVPRRVTAAKGEDPAAVAKQLAASEPDADVTAFAVDGSIEFDGSRHSGILVEAWNFRTSRGARVGLRYELKGAMRKKPSLLGSPLHLGRQGWYDPEDGEPVPRAQAVPTFPEVVPVASAPPPPAPPLLSAPPAPPAAPAVHDLGASGFGPPPSPESLAPADEAPAPPPSSYPAPTPSPAPPAVEPPALPRAFSAPLAQFPPPTPAPAPTTPAPAATSGFGPPPVASPDFGPPPTSAPVLGFPPPESARPPRPVDTPAQPVVAQPTVVRPVDVSSAPPAVAPEYVPVPIQRNETPLGNRAMFAGIMELATKGRSFPAFAIVQKGSDWEQVTMTDASLEDAAASVRAYARTRTDADFVAFAVDGFVTVDGAQVSAVVVEVWEYATRVSFSVAQRYVATGNPPSPRLSGRPLMRTQDGWIDVPSSMTLGGQVQFGYRDPDPV